SSRRRHTRSKRDWSSDVCSSDLNFVSLFLYPHTSFLIAMDAFYIYILVGLFLYILCLFPSILLASRVITKPLEILTRSIQQFAEIGRASCRERDLKRVMLGIRSR